jgi:hypothetical protein
VYPIDKSRSSTFEFQQRGVGTNFPIDAIICRTYGWQISINRTKYTGCHFGRRTALTEAGPNLPRRLRMPVRDDWRKLAQAARDEQDPEKLMKLIEKLNRELETRSRDLYPDSQKAMD